MDNIEKPKILVVRFSSLGDVILTTALLPNLKDQWPDSEVVFLTKKAYASVFDGNPHVDRVHLFDPSVQPFSELVKEIKAENFDIIVDLHGNPRSFLIRLFTGAPLTVVVKKNTLARKVLVWFKYKSASLEKSVRERILDTLTVMDIPVKHSSTQLFPDKNLSPLIALGVDPTRKLIGIAPGAKHATKQWGVEKFAEAGNRLGAFPHSQVLVLGDKSDKPVAADVFRKISVPAKNLAGFTTLKELVSVVSRLSILITNDSGIMHIAEAMDIPLVALFGPTVRSFGFAPYKPTSRVAELINLPCRPCSLHGTQTCPLRHHQCMAELDPSAVMFVASDLLEKTGTSRPT